MQSKGHLENIRAQPAMVTRKKEKRKDIRAKQAYINKTQKVPTNIYSVTANLMI